MIVHNGSKELNGSKDAKDFTSSSAAFWLGRGELRSDKIEELEILLPRRPFAVYASPKTKFHQKNYNTLPEVSSIYRYGQKFHIIALSQNFGIKSPSRTVRKFYVLLLL